MGLHVAFPLDCLLCRVSIDFDFQVSVIMAQESGIWNSSSPPGRSIEGFSIHNHHIDEQNTTSDKYINRVDTRKYATIETGNTRVVSRQPKKEAGEGGQRVR